LITKAGHIAGRASYAKLASDDSSFFRYYFYKIRSYSDDIGRGNNTNKSVLIDNTKTLDVIFPE
jgi:hypothetical protein